MSADDDGGGGFATVGASRRAARLQRDRPDYRALHRGKPTTQRRSHASSAPEVSKEATLDDIIDLLRVVIEQNRALTEQNEALIEQGARNEEEIRRLSNALEMSEETQAKMEERIGKMEKQMINTTYASVLRGAAPPIAPSNGLLPVPTATTRVTNLPAPIVQQMPLAIEIDLTEANVDTTKPGEIRAQL